VPTNTHDIVKEPGPIEAETDVHAHHHGWRDRWPDAAGRYTLMDGRGRALDNMPVQRLWRSVKQEHVYLQEDETVMQLKKGMEGYLSS